MKSPLKAFILLAALSPVGIAVLTADPVKSPSSVPPAPEPVLREIGATPTPAVERPEAPEAAEPTPEPSARHHDHNHGDDRVTVLGSTKVGANESIEGSAVAVMGSVVVDGAVSQDAVAVLGSNTINGTVHGDAVAVLGNLRLGPNARVDGDTVCVGGRLIKDSTATVGGREVEKPLGYDSEDDPQLSAWLHHGLAMGRPLALGAHLLWFWVVYLFVVGVYVLLALMFPEGVRKCGDTLASRPGATFLTGILTILALPVLFILLLVTVVGIPVAVVVLPLALVACFLFGKTAIYALVGRSVLGKESPVVFTVLVAVLLFVVLYFVPFLGGALWLIVGFLGYSCVLTTLFTKKAMPAVGPPVPPAAFAAAAAMPAAVPAPEAVQSAAAVPAPEAMPAPGTEAAPVAPAPTIPLPPALAVVSEAGLPRAGFWIRMLALLIDMILVGIVTHAHSLFPIAIALYAAILWKVRGATIGGIIFGLKVVRVDGRPSDWATMSVRAIACFFSLIVVGLGFFWIAFDPQKQAWHDKIAGTVVVRTPKAISLV